jgi:hypothetical protein
MGVEDMVPDLGRLGRNEGQTPPSLARVPGHAAYVNDLEVAYDNAGVVTVQLFYRTNQGVHDPVTVSMPVGLLMQLAEAAQQLGEQHMLATVRRGQLAEQALANVQAVTDAGDPLQAAREARDAG